MHCQLLSAAVHEEFRDFTQARSFLAIRSKLRNCLPRKLFRDLVGAFEAEDGGICGFLLSDVLAGGFSERSGRFFDVKNVVRDLEGPTDCLSKISQSRNVRFRSSRANCASGDGRADKG